MMKRTLAAALTLVMLLGLAPFGSAAAEQASTILAQEVTVSDDRVAPAAQREPNGAAAYAPDEMVTVIVQLRAPALLESYDESRAANAALSGVGQSAGEAVAQYLSSDEVRAANRKLLADQGGVITQIRALTQPGDAALMDTARSVTVLSQWTTLFNGLALRVPYGALESIKALDSVANAYVERTFAAPAPPTTTAGTEGYSYDMVGLTQAWEAGYTGQGMLIAIMDTGLDLEWASYWDDAAGSNITGIRRTHEAFRENSFKSADPNSFVRIKNASDLAAQVDHASLHASQMSPAGLSAIYKNRKVPYAFDYAGDVIAADDGTTIAITGDVNVYPGSNGSNHGTHVAGTAAGYAATEEGELIFTGTAPDAQIAMFKVFNDDGRMMGEISLLNALEDAVRLGVDVINLSLGSDNGFADDDTASGPVYQNVARAGIIMMTSAGNSSYSGTNNALGDYYPAASPDTTRMSSPAIYATNLAVASINSSVESKSYLEWSDGSYIHAIPFSDPNTVAMKATFGSGYESGSLRIYDAGYGRPEDYRAAGFGATGSHVTGIALVKRGGTDPETGSPLSFSEKVKNASAFMGYDPISGVYYGVRAVIIYDSDPNSNSLINMSVTNADVESCFISGTDGKIIYTALRAGEKVTLWSVRQDDQVTAWDQAGEMSEFTTWGAGPALELKPEITAPGGNIWSSIFDLTYREGAGTYDDYVGDYGMMSGTSMSAPHMSGLGALVRQYIRDRYPSLSGQEDLLAQRLLVSTALPQKDKRGIYYSPRQQGAGLVNIGAAISTPAYITAQDNLVGKLELGDDKDWTGRYELGFTVRNLTDAPISYTAKAVLLRPDTKVEEGVTFVLDRDVVVKEVPLDPITVPAGGAADVSRTVALTSSEVKNLKSLFPNGVQIEGFVILTAKDQPQIGLPFLGFLGDWTAAPIYDTALWTDGCSEKKDPTAPDSADPWKDGKYVWNVSIVGSEDGGWGSNLGYRNLGQNPFDPFSETKQKVYHKENLVLSPNGDGYLDAIDDFILYQLRDAKVTVFQVTDADTGEVYFQKWFNYLTRTDYYAELDAAVPSSVMYKMPVWDGTDAQGNVLPSGTKVNYTITSYGEGEYGDKVFNSDVNRVVTDFDSVADGSLVPTFNGHAMDMTGDVIRFPVTVDTVAPKLVNSAVRIYKREGRTYISGTVTDEVALASLEIAPLVRRTPKDPGSASDAVTRADRDNPFAFQTFYDPALKSWTFEVDVTQYRHRNGTGNDLFHFEWTGAVHLYCGDYGANDRTYVIQVNDRTGKGLLLSQTSALLHVGSEFDLSVIDNTGLQGDITRTSADENVATVDEFGNITAVGVGQTVITVSKGNYSNQCVVAVEEWPTEVEDFQLSIDRFDGLNPDGSIIVKVVDLQPADVVLREIRWSAEEDEETAQQYEGLINCSRYTSDGLAAEVYLNYNTVIPDENTPAVLAGSGILTVTLNGVSRSMALSWEDLYTSRDADGLVALTSGFDGEQVVYTTPGTPVTLAAMYRQNAMHSYLDVELRTSDGYVQGASNQPTTAPRGLLLDGPTYASSEGKWIGKLVNKADYALPEDVVVCYLTSDGRRDYYTPIRRNTGETLTGQRYYTYDPVTGNLSADMPAGGSLVIFAEGVSSPGAPAGTHSGGTWVKPGGLYGPFEWSVTQGEAPLTGKTETVTVTPYYGEPYEALQYTPDVPGVSHITATSQEGYGIHFAVVCEGVRATELQLDRHELTFQEGDAAVPLNVTLSPAPTLDAHKELVITSFNEDVVTVENGTLVPHQVGLAYVKLALKTDTTVQTYCLVTVDHVREVRDAVSATTTSEGYTGDVYCAVCGELLEEGTVIPQKTASSTPSAPAPGGIGGGSPAPETATDPDTGVSTQTVTGSDGSKIITVTVPTDAGDTVTLPGSPVPVDRNRITVTAPQPVTVIVPVTGADSGTVAVIIAADGSREIVKTSYLTENGLAVPLAGSTTIEILRNAKDFDDVAEDNWFAGAVDFVSAREIVNGVAERAFSPQGTTTRAMMMTMLARLHGVDTASGSTWYEVGMAWAVRQDISDGTNPDSLITREQLAVMLYRTAGSPAAQGDLSSFRDAASVSGWAVTAMEWAVERGVITGKSGGVLDPQGYATRAEVATMLQRFISL